MLSYQLLHPIQLMSSLFWALQFVLLENLLIFEVLCEVFRQTFVTVFSRQEYLTSWLVDKDERLPYEYRICSIQKVRTLPIPVYSPSCFSISTSSFITSFNRIYKSGKCGSSGVTYGYSMYSSTDFHLKHFLQLNRHYSSPNLKYWYS